MEKREKCIIIGPSGSGKDYLLRKMSEKGLKACLKWTTRPQRKFEIQGINYNFVSEDTFKENLDKGHFLSYQMFHVFGEENQNKIWYYGITNEEFKSSQVFIMTPGELENLSTDERKDCFVVYLDIERKIREKRILGRNDKNDSVSRRMDADEEDFKEFRDYDLKITDPEFLVEDIWGLMD